MLRSTRVEEDDEEDENACNGNRAIQRCTQKEVIATLIVPSSILDKQAEDEAHDGPARVVAA